MKTINLYQALGIMAIMAGLQSCELAGDIFQAGVWVGVFIVAIVVAAIVWMFSKFK